MCFSLPTPCRWENARQLLESVIVFTATSFLVRNLHSLPTYKPSAAPPTAERYSLSHELRAIDRWDRDHEVTGRPFKKIIADETECLLLVVELDWSPANQSL